MTGGTGSRAHRAYGLTPAAAELFSIEFFPKSSKLCQLGERKSIEVLLSQPVQGHGRCPSQTAWKALISMEKETAMEQRAAGACLALMGRISSGCWHLRDGLLLRQTQPFDQT